jgi:S1-C subfamily serine protease
MHAFVAPLICTSLFAAHAEAGPASRAIDRALGLAVTIEGSGQYGAGVLVDAARGLIVTNDHVVQGMSAPSVTFFDGAVAKARVVREDASLDLALLAVAPQPKRAQARWGDASALHAGDEVFAIGFPRRLGFTVSRGIVSYVDRRLEGMRYLQTDIPINEGNSGGPVIDEEGNIVGLMAFVYRNGQGLSFALPADYASRFTAAALALASRDGGRDGLGSAPHANQDPAPALSPRR